MIFKEFLKKFKKTKYFDGQVKVKKANELYVEILPIICKKTKVTINPKGDRADE